MARSSGRSTYSMCGRPISNRCQRPRNIIRRSRSDSSETKIGLGRGFDAERDPGVDKDDLLASPRQRLVEQTLGVPEPPGDGVFWHDAGADFIRTENHGAGELRDAPRQLFRSASEIGVLQDQIAEPKRRAIDHKDPI